MSVSVILRGQTVSRCQIVQIRHAGVADHVAEAVIFFDHEKNMRECRRARIGWVGSTSAACSTGAAGAGAISPSAGALQNDGCHQDKRNGAVSQHEFSFPSTSNEYQFPGSSSYDWMVRLEWGVAPAGLPASEAN